MIFILPAATFMVALFLVPLAIVFYTSVVGDDGSFTVASYLELMSRSLYSRVMETTLQISIVATIAALALGYPIAYHLSRQKPRKRAILIVFVLLPFWTSILVKSYAFIIILGTDGIVNNIMHYVFGIGPVKILFNRAGVIIGMVHYLLPFMILTLLASLVGQDAIYRRAASIMGASSWHIFRTVTFPLSLPGVVAGTLLCLILSLGMFVTPALLGGRSDIMVSNLIDFHVRQTLDWGAASALSVVLICLTAALMLLLARARGPLAAGGTH